MDLFQVFSGLSHLRIMDEGVVLTESSECIRAERDKRDKRSSEEEGGSAVSGAVGQERINGSKMKNIIIKKT